MRRRDFIASGGAILAWPSAAQPQKSPVAPRLAVVHPSLPVGVLTETGGNPYQQAFFAELRRLGYTEGTNLLIERHSGQGLGTEGLAELARY